MRVAVVGSGAWGTALAVHLTKNGHDTALWFRSEQKAALAEQTRLNPALQGIELPQQLRVTADAACVIGCEIVVIACPSFPIREVCKKITPYVEKNAVIVSVTKGIEPATLLRMSEVVEQELHRTVVALTGPSHAEEVALGIPTGCVAACKNREAAELVQEVFMSDFFRIYTSPDIVGAELGGALKNVIALCAGVCDGMGCGDNTKAMLMTRGLTEMARLGLSMGSSRETFAGLAGVGDLIVTCTSVHSRNRRAGILIGQGCSVQQAMDQVGAVVEGYYAAKSAWELCRKQGVEMPILQAAYSVLYESVSARDAVMQLLQRGKRVESENAGWE